MDKEEIINYVMETPGNSNPAVLGSMLEQYNSGSGSNEEVLLVYFQNIMGNTTCDKTFAEIFEAAFVEHKFVFGVTNNPLAAQTYMFLTLTGSTPNNITFQFIPSVASGDGTLGLTSLILKSDNTIERRSYTYRPYDKLYVSINPQTLTCDHTYQEIRSFFTREYPVYFAIYGGTTNTYSEHILLNIYETNQGEYKLTIMYGDSIKTLTTSSIEDYPVLQIN